MTRWKPRGQAKVLDEWGLKLKAFLAIIDKGNRPPLYVSQHL